MPQITKTSLALALAVLAFVGVLALGGCGDKNPQSVYDPDSGKHPAGWLPDGHLQAALAHLDNCTQCHGADLSGGMSKVACAQCHSGRFFQVHPPEWDSLAYARHPAYVRAHGAGFCDSAFCHGLGLTGGTVGGSGPSCSGCHIGGPEAVHPWANEAQDFAGNPPLHAQYVFVHGGTASCRNDTCHGAELQGVLLSGPACSACHFGKTFP